MSKVRNMSFPTGWDTPNDEDVQDWAMLEDLDGIGQRPLDAPEFIPKGSSRYEPDCWAYPTTTRRD